MKTILITGINKGLGKELFNKLVDKGYFVFGLLRNEETYKELLKNKPKNVELILADISNDNCIIEINKISNLLILKTLKLFLKSKLSFLITNQSNNANPK